MKYTVCFGLSAPQKLVCNHSSPHTHFPLEARGSLPLVLGCESNQLETLLKGIHVDVDGDGVADVEADSLVDVDADSAEGEKKNQFPVNQFPFGEGH